MAGEASVEHPERLAAAAAAGAAGAPAQAAAAESMIGRRVRVGGHLATVRWGPGPLQAPAKKPAPPQDSTDANAAPEASAPPAIAAVEVVGIEYDEAGHGKHDGTYQGARLFSCEHGFGSFAKTEKVEVGMGFQRALATKYFASMLPDAAKKGTLGEELDAIAYTDSKGREKEFSVELLGRYGVEQRQQRLESFMEMSLAESALESRYPDDVWEGDWSLPSLKSLWLDKTLLRDWRDVAAICERCPQLEWLSLARTRLGAPPQGPGPMPEPEGAPAPEVTRLALAPFTSQLKTLILNSTMVTWQDILAVDASGLFPHLEHLHLAQNRLTEGIPAELGASASQDEVEGTRRPLARLRTLVLDGNAIQDWRVLRRAVSAFSSLEALHLNANRLGESLDGLSDVAADRTPRRLTSLYLNENRLSSWAAVGALADYALLELKAQRNPLTEGEAAVASTQLLRQILIALMPTLLRLNASEVTVKERAAAEKYFLAIAQQDGHSVMQGLGETCDTRAHIERLRALHGDVVGGGLSETAQATRSALVHSLVEITLRPVGAAILDQPPTKKRVPHTMTVGELKRLSQKLFKQVPLPRIRLLLADGVHGFPLEDDTRELGFYGVCDGADVNVDDAADATGSKNAAHDAHVAEQIEGEV